MKKRVLSLCLLAGMALGTQAEDVYQAQRARWLKLAEQNKPELIHTAHHPVRVVKAVEDKGAYQGWRFDTDKEMTPERLATTNFRELRRVTLDFGDHLTGYISLSLRSLQSLMDAPTRLKLFLGEVPAEMNTPLDPWADNRLARSWMQDEVVTLTLADKSYRLDRRISGRYLTVELMGCSPSYNFGLDSITFVAETSARPIADDGLLPTCPQIIREIDRVGKATLRECMQTVYEDGPKRDRRLWTGDMYLESLANRYSYQNHQLTRRCLYLFAGLAQEDGILHGNIFEYPTPKPQIINYMVSYNLLYVLSLLEYWRDTKDRETTLDLWPVAIRQVEDALRYVRPDGIFDQSRGSSWNFFDWRPGIDVSVCIQALTINALQGITQLGRELGRDEDVKAYPARAKLMASAARKQMMDRKTGLFVSGKDRQVSVLSQAWMIRAGVLNKKEARRALTTVLGMPSSLKPGTPYATHYLIEAMLMAGMNDEARDYLTSYWGGMVQRGADTFFEAYDPQDDNLSPYNFSPVNSYCHAWSCTPVYFIHKYPEIFQK